VTHYSEADIKEKIMFSPDDDPVGAKERIFKWALVAGIIIFITTVTYKCDQNNIDYQLKLRKETVMKKHYNKKKRQWEYEIIMEGFNNDKRL